MHPTALLQADCQMPPREEALLFRKLSPPQGSIWGPQVNNPKEAQLIIKISQALGRSLLDLGFVLGWEGPDLAELLQMFPISLLISIYPLELHKEQGMYIDM